MKLWITYDFESCFLSFVNYHILKKNKKIFFLQKVCSKLLKLLITFYIERLLLTSAGLKLGSSD